MTEKSASEKQMEDLQTQLSQTTEKLEVQVRSRSTICIETYGLVCIK